MVGEAKGGSGRGNAVMGADRSTSGHKVTPKTTPIDCERRVAADRSAIEKRKRPPEEPKHKGHPRWHLLTARRSRATTRRIG